MSRKDLTKSQLDLVYGSESVEDSRSLSGVSIGSKGSSRGSEDIATGPSEFTLSKSNKGESHIWQQLPLFYDACHMTYCLHVYLVNGVVLPPATFILVCYSNQ